MNTRNTSNKYIPTKGELSQAKLIGYRELFRDVKLPDGTKMKSESFPEGEMNEV